MNNLDKNYLALCQDILDNGTKKKTRTGIDSISVFGREIRHKMSDGFPLLTTRKLYFKGIGTELIWFLRGDTNIKYLVDNGCNIWNGDAYQNYCKNCKDPQWLNPLELISLSSHTSFEHNCVLYTKDEFINKIKTDNEFAKKWGELGPIYGKQWRKWARYFREFKYDSNGVWIGKYKEDVGVDQIQNLINDLKTNPDSRRLMVNAWNVADLPNMVLPPCHYGFQCYTRELSYNERCDLYIKKYGEFDIHPFQGKDCIMDGVDIPHRAISLKWIQRSIDTPLGLSSNIPSYSLLLMIIGKLVNMVPEELIGSLGDCHIYENQIDGIKEQMGRELSWEERRDLQTEDQRRGRVADKNGLMQGDFGDLSPFTQTMIHYWCDQFNIPRNTREPFPLPTLKFSDKLETIFRKYRGEETINGAPDFGYYDQLDAVINSMEPSDFIVENYQSHPKINLPLSN